MGGFLKKLDEEAEKENKWWSAAFEEDEEATLGLNKQGKYK